MTRIERSAAAMANRPIDRFPTYIPAISCSVASQILGRPVHSGAGSLRYKEVLAWSRGEQAHAEFEQQLLADLLDLYRTLDIDVYRMPWRMNRRPTRVIDEQTFVFGDEAGAHEVWHYNPDSEDFSQTKIVKPDVPADELLRREVEQGEANLEASLAAVAAAVKTHIAFCQTIGREFFTVSPFGTISIGLAEEDMMNLAAEPQLVARKVMLQAQEASLAGELLAASPWPAVLIAGGDLAGNEGPMFSPASFREVLLPAFRHAGRRLNAAGAHYVFRSDGNLWSLADMLFQEAGLPGFGEVDRDATMTVGALRRTYPKLVLWGQISSNFLVRATKQQVIDECRRVLDEAGGTGYFHGCSNAIVKGTPPENVLAMFQTR